MNGLLQTFAPLLETFGTMGTVFQYIWFIVLPPILWIIFIVIWADHVRGNYFSKVTYTMLELIPPRDVEKSPFPMELVFDTLASTDKTFSTYEWFITGERLPRFSFEIVGDGGTAHFYIRTQARLRNFLEATLYGQYPDIQIMEVPDYTKSIPRGIPNKEWNLWGADFQYVKDNAYPIRTYRSFEEEVTGKMLDPLAHAMELIGKLPPGHRLWFQIIIQSAPPVWYKTGKKFIDALMTKMALDKKTGSDDLASLETKLTPVEKKILEAMELNVGKNHYDTRLRFLYIGPSATFDKASFVSGFVGVMKQFNDNSLNSLKPEGKSKTFANYIMAEYRLRYRQRLLLERYRTRDMDPFSTLIVMSSAELATIYHVPDMSVLAPNLVRVGAKRGTAPANLPVD